MTRIIVAGALANKVRNGGEAWVRLSWALGFRKLGYDVYLVEEIAPHACLDERGDPTAFTGSANLAYFREVTHTFGLADRSSLLLAGTSRADGLSRPELLDIAAGADLLVNISGHLRDEALLRACRTTAYVDIDPGFTQFWAADRVPGGEIAEHDVYFTIGENIGTAACSIPSAGIEWRTTRQPVVLEDWPEIPATFDRFTTVSSWRGPFGAIEHQGTRYSLKHHQFRRFLSLPCRTGLPFELALSIHPADHRDLASLHDAGWITVDPEAVARNPVTFRDYVQRSAAEFSPAQGVYVDTRSGWLSDRTARYLASGKPALVQDTGFARFLPVGDGLIPFRTLEEAVAGARRIVDDYDAHAAAARSIAEEYFDSDRVLTRFLADAIGGGAAGSPDRRVGANSGGSPVPTAVPDAADRIADRPRTDHTDAVCSRRPSAPRTAPAARHTRRTMIVSGMIAGVPGQGGATWAVLQYLLGLRALGHEVYFIEPIERGALRPHGAPLADSANAAYFRAVTGTFGFRRHASLLTEDDQRTVGLRYDELKRIARRADLILNISGMLTDRALLDPIPRRAYLDLDPAFVQLWADQGIDMRFAAHTHFVTIGLTLGTPASPIPTVGREWIPTPQPIALDHWPIGNGIRHDAFTTVANWRGYGSVEHDGVLYGQKAHSLRPIIDLPRRTEERFRLALSIHPEEVRDLTALDANGWELVPPERVTATPASYAEFVRTSRAELGIAKSGYVVSRCGWFSDRSICYLASGRPVVAQETGFSEHIPAGEGLLAFSTADEAVAAIDSVRRDYPRHSRRARDLAERYFDAGIVLPRLLQQLEIG